MSLTRPSYQARAALYEHLLVRSGGDLSTPPQSAKLKKFQERATENHFYALQRMAGYTGWQPASADAELMEEFLMHGGWRAAREPLDRAEAIFLDQLLEESFKSLYPDRAQHEKDVMKQVLDSAKTERI